MNKDIITSIWDRRKIIAEISTTAFVICKGLVDFARKDGIGKVFALTELGVGLGAAAIHTGVADNIVRTIAERKAAYEGLSPEGPDPYDKNDSNLYDPDEEDATEIDAEYDEDGFDPMEFDEFINSGEYPESEEDSLEADETNEDTDEEEE